MKPPTARQLEVLAFLARYFAEHGFAASTRDIAKHFGWCLSGGPEATSGSNAVNDHLVALQRKGLITRLRLQPRTVRITDAGWAALGVKPGHCPHCGNAKQSTAGAA